MGNKTYACEVTWLITSKRIRLVKGVDFIKKNSPTSGVEELTVEEIGILFHHLPAHGCSQAPWSYSGEEDEYFIK